MDKKKRNPPAQGRIVEELTAEGGYLVRLEIGRKAIYMAALDSKPGAAWYRVFIKKAADRIEL